MKRNPKRVLVGMSGGVDSSVAACLLHEQGYEVIGITIKTYRYEDVGGNVGNDSSCCSLDGINDARRVCNTLGIPHYVVDWSERFKEEVIDYFVEDYLAGNTPNPCVKCNRLIKWGQMLLKADMLGAEWIATGHYANIRKDSATERYVLSRDSDNIKDQSYALWGLKQEHLSRTLFPLSGYTKDRSRADAERFGLTIAKKPESYEICFIPDNDYKHIEEGVSIQLPGKTNKLIIIGSGDTADIYIPHLPEECASLQVNSDNVIIRCLAEESVKIQQRFLPENKTTTLKHNQILTLYHENNEEKFYRFIFYNRLLDPQA